MTYKRFFFTACLIFVFLFTSTLFSQTTAVDNSPTTVKKSKNENNTIKVGKHINIITRDNNAVFVKEFGARVLGSDGISSPWTGKHIESKKDGRVVDPLRVNIPNYNDRGSADIAPSVRKGVSPGRHGVPDHIKKGLNLSPLQRAGMLYVDDDGGGATETLWETSFSNLGYLFDKWVVSDSIDVAPDSAAMGNYTIVVWSTAGDFGVPGSITLTDTTEIGKYLNGGGKLWLSSQDALYDLGSAASWMHLSAYFNDLGCIQVTGIDIVMNPLTFPTTGGVFFDYSDEVTPDGISWSSLLNEFSNTNSVAMDVTVGLSYFLYYNTFAWENINNEADRDTMMKRVLTWMGYLPAALDVGVTAITSPPQGYVTPGNYDVIGRIRNLGSSSTTFNVMANVYDTTAGWLQIFNQFASYVNFPSGGDSLYNFGINNFYADAVFYTEIYTQLVGDENLSNDTASVYSWTLLQVGDIIYELDVQTPTGDDQLLGVEFDGTYFYVSGAGGMATPDPNYLYVIDTLGNLIWEMDQLTPVGWGWRDLAWDNVYTGADRIDTLYASESNVVEKLGIDLLTGTLTNYGSYLGPENPNRALAWMDDNLWFWTANFSSPVYWFDKVGGSGSAANAWAMYGAAYDTDPVDGGWIWWHSQDLAGYPLCFFQIEQFDPNTMTFTGFDFGYQPTLADSGYAGGLCFYEGFRGMDVLFALVQGNPVDEIIGIYIRKDTTFDHDVGVVSIDAPPISIMPSTTLDPTATFKNYGIFDETFDVYFDIDTNGAPFYNDTRNITVASGAESTVAFNSCIFGDTIGFTYDITVYTVLGGDEYSDNDTLTQQTTINPYFWEILDPPVFPAPTAGHSEAAGDDGYIYVTGCGAGNNELHIYDISNDTWTAGANNPTGAAYYGTANWVGGLVYRIGGYNGAAAIANVDIYDPAGNSWSSGVNAPAALCDHISGVYNDSLVFVFGGGNWFSGVGTNTNVYFYDVYNDTWTTATNFPSPGRGCLGGGVIDTFAIVACGFDDVLWGMRKDYVVGVIDPTNPANITWGPVTDIPGMDSLYRMSSGVDPFNKELWLTQGQKWTVQTNRTWSYDPYTDVWTEYAFPKPQVVANVTPIAITTTTFGDLGLYVAGGYYDTGNVDDHEVFHTGRYAAPLLANNVGTQAINNPGASILINETINPSATFRNYGTMPATFGIFFKIDSSGTNVYTNSQIISLNPAENTTVVFPTTWTSGPNEGIVYDVMVYTALLGDMDTSNDTLIRQTITTLVTDWIRCADRPTAEMCHATCYDSVGDKIYTFGGTRAGGLGGYYNWTYQYDPVTDAWATMAPMPSAIDWIDASVIQWNRKIYILGGFDGIAHNYNYIYDIGSDSWSSGTLMPLTRSIGGHVVYNDSLIYMLGGYDGIATYDNVQIYNTYTDSWTNGTNLLLPFMMGGVAILGDTIWIIGGTAGVTGFSNLYYGVIDPLNCENIIWSTGDALPYDTLLCNGATQMYRGGASYLYIVGGFTGAFVSSITNLAWEYNFVTDGWTALPDYPMTITRNDFLVARDGATYPEIYVSGGDNQAGGINWSETNQTWKLRWAVQPELAIKLSSFTADYKKGKVVLRWKTECEKNNALWMIDRKEGKGDWKTVTTIPSEGNSPCGYSYEYRDKGVLENRRYTYRLGDIDTEGKLTWRMTIVVFTHDINAPKVFGLAQNYPNPFIDRTTIKYQVPVKTKVEIDIYDVSGRHIKRIVNEVQEPGYYRAIWDGTNKNNRATGMGMYFCRMSTDNYTKTRRLIRF